MKYSIISIVAILIFSNSSALSQQASLQKIQMFKYLLTNEVIALTIWPTNQNDLFCTVIIDPDQILESESTKIIRQFDVYQEVNKEYNLIFSMKTLDNFVSMYPTEDIDSNLVTVWTSGSAYHIIVFSFNGEEKVNIVLDEHSKIHPEIIDFDNDGVFEIFISYGNFLYDQKSKIIVTFPNEARLFKWNGKLYQQIKKIGWKNRFRK
jgi:hypothetical protein